MIAPPGSILWLLHHELRVGWRRMRARQGGRGRRVRLLFSFGVPIVLTLLIGLPTGSYLRMNPLAVTPETVAVGALVTAALFTLMLSQTLTLAVDALYQRGDLDLLFSSPLNPRTTMTVRFLAVAVDAFSVFGYFLTGPVLAIAFLAGAGWIAAMVVLAGLALAASGAGVLLAWGLFRLIGPRRTRTAAQVMAAVIGAAFFLIAQTRNIFGRGAAESLMTTAIRVSHDPRLNLPGLDWPLRAVMGEPLPLLGIVVTSVAVFWLANAILGPRFAADAAAAAGAGHGGRRARGGVRSFAAGPFAATLRKELRLLARDPALITQVMMRVLYMVPLGVLLVRQAGQGGSLAMPGSAAALSLVAGQVAASIAWITISAEEAPDLLTCAPSPIAVVRHGKLAAAALPPAVLLLPVLLPLMVFAPWVGLMAALGCAASIGASSLINVWWQKPVKRSEFRTRRGASWFVTVAELLMGGLIAGATGTLAAGTAWGLAFVVAAAIVFLTLRRSDARVAEALREAS